MDAFGCVVLNHFNLVQYMLYTVPVVAVSLMNYTAEPSPSGRSSSSVQCLLLMNAWCKCFDHSVVSPDVTHVVLLSLFPCTARSASARVRRTERETSGITSPSKCLTARASTYRPTIQHMHVVYIKYNSLRSKSDQPLICLSFIHPNMDMHWLFQLAIPVKDYVSQSH